MSRGSPSFLKILLEDDFTQRIRIPPAFMKKYEEFSNTNWILKTDSFNRSWYIKVVQNGRDCYISKCAWRDFAEAHELKSGDFLLFQHVGCSMEDLPKFHVVLYSASGLPKGTRCPRPSTSAEEEEEEEEEGEGEEITIIPSADSARLKRKIMRDDLKSRVGCSTRSEKFKQHKTAVNRVKEEPNRDDDIQCKAKAESFSTTLLLKKSMITRMILPSRFVKQTKMNATKKLVLINERGRRWKIKTHTCTAGRIFLGAGWSAFRHDNELQEDDEYRFTLIQNEENMLLFRKVGGMSGRSGSN